jgi:hypothetical protein
MDAGLKSTDFQASGGLTVPTQLKDPQYNNRTAGGQIIATYGPDATGQVVFVNKDPIAAPAKLKVRVLSGGGASVRAGLAQTANITTIDGVWDGGYFHAVDA